MKTESKSSELGDRARYRLRLCAGLVQSEGVRLSFARSTFYPEMIAYIEGLSDVERARIRALTDWAEEFDPADTLVRPTGPRRST